MRYSEQLILNNAWSGEISLAVDDTPAAAVKSARFFHQAADLLSQWGEPKGRLIGLNYDMEYLLFSEAKACSVADKMNELEKAMEKLDILPNKRLSTEDYITILVQETFIPCHRSPIAFLQKWLENHGQQKGAGLIVFLLSEAFLREKPKNYIDLAKPYLVSLADGRYSEEIMQRDGDLLSTGTGGRYASVLQNLVNLCIEEHDYLKAGEYNTRFLNMFSNDSGAIENAKRLESWLNEQGEIQTGRQKQFDSSTRPFLCLRLALPILSALFLIYFVYRRRAKFNESPQE